jgi:hypothetical protein
VRKWQSRPPDVGSPFKPGNSPDIREEKTGSLYQGRWWIIAQLIKILPNSIYRRIA